MVYDVPSDLVFKINVVYDDTSAFVITPGGETRAFSSNTDVLQGDILPHLFLLSASIMGSVVIVIVVIAVETTSTSIYSLTTISFSQNISGQPWDHSFNV